MVMGKLGFIKISDVVILPGWRGKFAMKNSKITTKKSRMFEAMKTRDRDFLKVCRRIRENQGGARLTMRQVAGKAVKTEAPGYYVTFDYAYRMLRLLRNGRISPDYNRIKIQQWEELRVKVDKVRKSYGIRDDATALGLVLAGGRASRFFISQAYGLRLLKNLNSK